MEDGFGIIAFFAALSLLSYSIYWINSVFEKIIENYLENSKKGFKKRVYTDILFGTFYTFLTLGLNYSINITSSLLNVEALSILNSFIIFLGSLLGTIIIVCVFSFRLIFHLWAYLIVLGTGIFFLTKTKKFKDIGRTIVSYGFVFLSSHFIYSTLIKSEEMLFLSKNIIILSLVVFIITIIFQNNIFIFPMIFAILSYNNLSKYYIVDLLLLSNIALILKAMINNYKENVIVKKSLSILLIYSGLLFIIFLTLQKLIHKQLNLNFNHIYALYVGIIVTFTLLIVLIINPYKKFDLNDDNYISKKKFLLLHEINLQNPSIAIMQVIKEIINMGYDALNNVSRSLDLILNYDSMISQNLLIIENDINHYEKEITESLVKLSNTEINEHQSKIIAALYHIINDIERIGDHAENLYELAEHKYKNSLIFSDEAIVEIKFMYQYVMEAVDLALSSLKDGDLQKAMKTIELESKIDKLDKQLRNGHIDRLNTGICYPESGAIFLDIISNLERIGDHANNIAQLVIEINQ